MADLIYVCDDGANASLDSVTGKSPNPIGAKVLRLVRATFTPSKTRVIADFTPQGTFEANFTGYASIALSSAAWAAAAASSNVSSSADTNHTFTRSATGTAQSIYGWIITDAGYTKLYAVCFFSAGPYVLTNNGDNILVSNSLTAQSLN